MRNHGKIPYFSSFALILACVGMLLAQGTPDRTLFVNGKSEGTVVEIDGRSYVDVDTVAQILSGSVTVEPNRILITITGPVPVPVANPVAGPPPAVPQGVSKD